MSRVEGIPTYELVGKTQEDWINGLRDNGSLDYMIKFYNDGMKRMNKINRDVMNSRPYSHIVGFKVGFDVMINARNKTIDFYRIRLSELEDAVRLYPIETKEKK